MNNKFYSCIFDRFKICDANFNLLLFNKCVMDLLYYFHIVYLYMLIVNLSTYYFNRTKSAKPKLMKRVKICIRDSKMRKIRICFFFLFKYAYFIISTSPCLRLQIGCVLPGDRDTRKHLLLGLPDKLKVPINVKLSCATYWKVS